MRTRQLIDTDMPMCMNDSENLTAVQTAMLRAVAMVNTASILFL